MFAFKKVLPQSGDRVHIVPIQENGTVIKCRRDDRDELLIDVRRDSDGESHVCREWEVKPIQEITLADNRGKTVRLSLNSQNDGKTAVVKINDTDYPVAFDFENGVLKLCVWQTANTDQPTETFELKGYES